MPAPDGRHVGLAHLSLLDVDPPTMVELAARAGFDFVGLRVRAVTDVERPYDLQPGSPLINETLGRLQDHGLVVKDIEFLLLDGTDQRDAWMRMFEAGRALGATSLTVAVGDTEATRARESLARMAEDGRPFGITPSIEPISYQAVRSLPDALTLAEGTGCDVLPDTLHVARFGGKADELAAAAGRVPLVQLCDAPALAPVGRDALIEESRAGRAAPGAGALDLAGVVAAVESGLVDTPRAGSHLPVSVEVPDLASRRALSDDDWAARLYTGATAVLTGMTPGRYVDNPETARTTEEDR